MTTAAAHTATARAFLDALGATDIQAMLPLMHPDLVWEVPGRSPAAGRHVGLEAVGGMMLTISAMSGGTERLELRELFANDRGVVALLDIFESPPGDEPWHGEDAWLIRTDGEQITEIREHWFDTRGFDELSAWSSQT